MGEGRPRKAHSDGWQLAPSKILGSRRIGVGGEVGSSEVKPALGESWGGRGARGCKRWWGDSTRRRGALPTQSVGQGRGSKERNHAGSQASFAAWSLTHDPSGPERSPHPHPGPATRPRLRLPDDPAPRCSPRCCAPGFSKKMPNLAALQPGPAPQPMPGGDPAGRGGRVSAGPRAPSPRPQRRARSPSPAAPLPRPAGWVGDAG